MVAMTRLQRWLAPKIQAGREADTQRFIADDPTVVTVRRQGRPTDLTLTVRIVRAGTRSSRTVQSEAVAGAASDVTITAVAGSDIKRGDRLAVGGVTFLVTFVMPGQDFRLEADAVVEQ